mgnify:CR=1 FL=1
MNDGINKKIETFFSQFKRQTYKKGEIVIRADDDPKGVFYLEEGYVKKYVISKKGDELTLYIFKPTLFFPLGWSLNKSKNNYFYEARTSVIARCAPRDKFIEFIKSEPDLLFELIKRIHRDGLLAHMTYLMAGNAYTRLAAEIYAAVKILGEVKNGSAIIPISEKELASMTGITRETVSREIKILKEKRLIEFSRSRLIIKNIKKLEKELII